MFLAGLELHLEDLLKSGKVAALAGSLGVALPVVMGYAVGRFFGMETVSALLSAWCWQDYQCDIGANADGAPRAAQSRGHCLAGRGCFRRCAGDFGPL